MRIERDKAKFDEAVSKDEELKKSTGGRFFREYRLGYTYKRVAIIEHDGAQWIGRGLDPNKKVYGKSVAAMLQELLPILR
jgi:hypothetical protein